MLTQKYATRLPTDAETLDRMRELVGTNLDNEAIPMLLVRMLHVLEALVITQQGILQEKRNS